MTTSRFPDVTVDPNDFGRCGWREALAECERGDSSSMWGAFSAKAEQALGGDRAAEGKVLWLLADACSMMLKPASPNEPFAPRMVMGANRSPIPEDFCAADVDFFSQIVEQIDDICLRARLADLVWLLKTPRDPKFALLAIEAYRQVPLDAKPWVRGGIECRERALRLAIMLGDRARDYLQAMESDILAILTSAQADDGFLSLWLADLLDETGLGASSRREIASKMETLARSFDGSGDIHRARQYSDAAAKWYLKAGDEASSTQMLVEVAEGWAKEAAGRMSGENASYIAGATFLEKAIQVYRRIPGSRRATLRVDERISELHRLMTESGEKSLTEMKVIRSPDVDITEFIDNARKAVRGKTPDAAIEAFANIHRGAQVVRIRESAAALLRQHPLQSLFSATMLSHDGRTIAKRPAINTDLKETPEEDEAIWSEMVRHYGIEVSIAVHGDIWPALEVLSLEHRFAERDFVTLATHSPVVPAGRERLIGKGLFAGFERDFVVATHLLVPQVEHIVRWHLKQHEVKTTTLDSRGIENEVGLSALLEKPEVKKIFGENLLFEFRATFADPFGPNLRNEVAHGLMEYNGAQSVFAIYAWWWILRLIFKAIPRSAPPLEHRGNDAPPVETSPESGV